MRYLLSTIILPFLLLSLPGLAMAADSPVSPSDGSSSSGSVDQKAVEDLIGTLESETERQALIDKLKLMVNTEEESASVLGSLIDFESAGSGITQDFVVLMESYGLPENIIGDLVSFSLTVLLVLAGLFFNARVAAFLDRRLRPVRKRLHWSKTRFDSVFLIQRWAGYAVGLVLIGYAAAQLIASYLSHDGDSIVLGSAMNIVLTVTVVVLIFNLIWEGVNALLESVMHRHEALNNSRFQTITPIIRNILLITLTLLSLMVILSEVGINIMPLLAGAGVLGIAVGFGAQTLVKDFLTGLTVIFEDLLQIGDVVKLGDHFGLVEKITLRKIQLRDLEGTVHTIPFGEVAIVSNLTKDFSFYLFDIGVAYRENTDEVIKILHEIDEELREDDDFKDRILEPLEVFGVDQFADSAVMIKARIKTRPIQQWNVGREFNRRIKIAFDERGIEIPFPHQTIYFGEDKQGRAPNANVHLTKNSTVDPSNDEKEIGREQGRSAKPKDLPEDLPEKNSSDYESATK